MDQTRMTGAERLDLFEASIKQLNEAMNDGLNVHGAMAQYVGLRDELEYDLNRLNELSPVQPAAG